jgi:hypothetical protein
MQLKKLEIIGGKHDSSGSNIYNRIDSGNVRRSIFPLAEPGRGWDFLFNTGAGMAVG